ncbi:uncharacterized protein AC631_03486 [Debaryomyces fabryi]|uniref:Gfd2/YDR514C-like C-terminal domain-containing protein n=1 Tax=Debaryomyces fabryi TaxID=58627 RepID=A0A0V1PX02_9ASCO|nr:uncharacterized protein AC631_03486 [Debaryomyces fabryi]KSA00775.1 hypothetical protein AC631_03486 [Debaryomyces fabryi]CUM45198.1 unnamed protein product [Debaryomyces fabryi]
MIEKAYRSSLLINRFGLNCTSVNVLRSFVSKSIQQQKSNQATPVPTKIAKKTDDAKIKHLYKQNLEDYFKHREFKFKGESQQKDLQKWMESIYLRKKILIAIDIEAWERNINKVTEIGIAVYNPDEQLYSILPKINQFHILIREHEKMYNGRYCPNNKGNFMGGVSYTLELTESKKFVESIINKYSHESKEGIVLVGHHIEGDLKWLRSIGIQIPSDVPIVDTARIHRLSYESGGSLRGILRKVGIPHGYLHNAANDAYYTLLASLAYCDPHTRIQNELDKFHPHIIDLSKPSNKARKRRERMYDTSINIQHSNALELFKELFSDNNKETE